MIKEWLQQYNPQTKGDAEFALREIMQEVALAGLYRSGFFEKAAFYGGTALRIFYDLDRFSEDLDFSLLTPDPKFSLEPYFESIVAEFAAIGLEVTIREKKKSVDTAIESAFLKAETVWKELVLQKAIPQTGLESTPAIKIKLEVDRQPPPGFDTEEKLLLQPFSFYVKCFTPPNLFAGKLHALLFRKWKQRVKGRDWYDFEWYVRKAVPLNLQHLLRRAQDSGDWTPNTLSKAELKELLHKRIETVSFDRIKEDVVRFIPDAKKIDIWSKKYFSDLVEKMKFE